MRAVALLGLAAACALPARAWAAAPLPRGWDPARFISTAEVKPGMKGVGYTVFQGTTIETFEVEVIGVIYGYAPARDAIIARIAGGPIDTAGVIQGMSGSPIYLDGRLAGAVAFGWTFMTEPICGIQPIQHMLPVLHEAGTVTPTGMATPPSRPAALELSAEQVATLEDFPVQGGVRLEPLATPISVGGIAPEFIEQIRPWFKPYGLIPMAGGGVAADYGDLNPALEPGAALALPLITGDISAAAIGTVTYTEGDRVVGFGHPFRYAGEARMPMGNAFIVGVLPNQQISTKLGVALRTLGSLQQDQVTAVAGTLGAAPAMVPMAVSVQGPNDAAPRTFSFDVVPDRTLLPLFMGIGSSSAVFDSIAGSAPYTAQIDMTIRPAGYAPITSHTFHSARGGVAWPVGMQVMQYARALLDNPYGRLTLEGVEMQVTVRAGLGIAYLEEVRPRHLTVRPGETLPVTVVYRRHEGERERQVVTLQIPDTARDGMHTLVVSDARRTLLLEYRRAPMRYRATTIEQYLEILNQDYPENELTVTLLSPRPGMAVHGQELAKLPGSVLNVMRSAAARDLARPTRGTVVAQEALPLDSVFAGAAVVRIRVDRHAP